MQLFSAKLLKVTKVLFKPPGPLKEFGLGCDGLLMDRILL